MSTKIHSFLIICKIIKFEVDKQVAKNPSSTKLVLAKFDKAWKNYDAMCTKDGMKVHWVLFVPTNIGYLVTFVCWPLVSCIVCHFCLVVWHGVSSFAKK